MRSKGGLNVVFVEGLYSCISHAPRLSLPDFYSRSPQSSRNAYHPSLLVYPSIGMNSCELHLRHQPSSPDTTSVYHNHQPRDILHKHTHAPVTSHDSTQYATHVDNHSLKSKP